MRETASSISGVTWEGLGVAQKPVGVAWKVADVVKKGFRVDWKPFLVTQKTGFVSLKVGEMEWKASLKVFKPAERAVARYGTGSGSDRMREVPPKESATVSI
jgi:hypothetical protein